MFRRGLKDNLKDEIMRDGRSMSDMTDLIEVAVDLDDRLYERAIEKRYDQPHGRAGTFFGPTTGYHAGGSRSNRYSNPDYRGPAPMELDSTQRRKRKHPRGEPDDQQEAREQTDTEADTPGTGSDDDYYLVENPDDLQKILDGTSSGKEFNEVLRRKQPAELPKTPYPHSPATDSDDGYNWKDFHDCMDTITN